MKTQWIRSIGCILAVLILSGIMPLAAQDNAERYTTISGVVKDKLNKKETGVCCVSTKRCRYRHQRRVSLLKDSRVGSGQRH